MKDVSIEYAHIYTNAKISEEHKLSLEMLGTLRGPSQSLVVLVDDYSFPDPSFDYGAFTVWLTEQGHAPDVVMRESQLIPLCDKLLSELRNQALKEDLVRYVQSKKYPCSLFIASWYLLRLGKLEHPSFPPNEYAAKLINILPESFKPFEEKGIEIIRASPYAELAAAIENRYIEGRLIT